MHPAKHLIYPLLFILLLPVILKGQDSVVIFMNQNFEPVEDIEVAVIKRDAIIKDNRYYISDQYTDGRKILEGQYNSVNPWTEDGPFVFYDNKGEKYAEGNYSNGIMIGHWIYYDSTGNDTVFYKNEWMGFVNAQKQLISNNKVFNNPDVRFYNYVYKNLHFPPKYVFECKSRSEAFNISFTSEREIYIMTNPALERDFAYELYRVLAQCPDSIIYSKNNKRKRLDLFTHLDYSCPDESIDLSYYSCNRLVYVFVEQQASFLGGTFEDFRNWVQMNLTYPVSSIENNEMGRVIVQFIVTEKGKVDCIKILRSSGYPSLDKEALRVVDLSPIWSPAKEGGKIVNQQFVMPIIFQIQDINVH